MINQEELEEDEYEQWIEENNLQDIIEFEFMTELYQLSLGSLLPHKR
jgi:hypothetical protein